VPVAGIAVALMIAFVLYGGYRRFRFETAMFGRSRWVYGVFACALAFIFIVTALIVRAAS
jgi:hypothetical protein